MADDELVPDEGLVTDGVPAGEGEAAQVAENVNDEAESSDGDPIEAIAVEFGWMPKDKFRGNPDDWKPAEEYVRATGRINRNLSRELKDIRGQFNDVARTTELILADKIAERDAYWLNKRNEGIENGDRELVDQADEQRQRLRLTMPNAQPAPTPEGKSFAEKHSSWFGKDAEATDYATKRCLHYAEQGLSHARQLVAVENDMKGIFPDLFPAPRRAPTVNQPGSRSAGPSNRKKGFADLTPAQQKVARDMAERGVIPSAEDYVKYAFKETVG